jgi:hypothetical protein
MGKRGKDSKKVKKPMMDKEVMDSKSTKKCK